MRGMIWPALALVTLGWGGDPSAVGARGGESESLEFRLERAPDDPELLELAGLEALEAEDPDRAAWLLLEALERSEGDSVRSNRIARQLDELEYPWGKAQDLLEEHAQELFRLARTCASSKRFVTAVDLLHRCAGTPLEDEARERLEELYGKRKVVDALLESGVDVPLAAGSRYSPEEMARLDAAHSRWEDAHVIDGENYRVRTNMSIEVARSVAESMEQINAFYRQFYGYRTRTKSMRSCEVRLYARRADFDRHEPSAKPTHAGFYQPGDNYVATFDPREDETPRPLASLWGTLFHEASHQFTRALWPNSVPTWLNEGTACYFEGARIQRGGRVSFNGIPGSRLRSLVRLLDEGEPTLEEVITYSGDGSYEGSYYPFGWGLVYFLRNYEDASFERVYAPHFEAYMAAYKSGEQHDVMERFVEHFVEAPGRDGIEDFGGLEALWKDWIRELHRLEFGGPEVADELLDRARAQRATGHPASAAESYRWALRKRPGDLIATNELANLLADQGAEDAALHTYLELAALASTSERPEDIDPDPHPFAPAPTDWRALAEEGMSAVDARFAERLRELERETADRALELIETCEAAGFPRGALAIASHVGSLVTEDPRLDLAEEELRARVDIRRWERLSVTEGLDGWSGHPAFHSGSEVIHFDAPHLAFLTPPVEVTDDYRIEAIFEVDEHGPVPCIGLTFGETPTRGRRMLVAHLTKGSLFIGQYVNGSPTSVHDFRARVDTKATRHRLALEVRGGLATAYIDGRSAGEFRADALGIEGRPGLLAQQAKGRILEVRLLR
jgi:hypothetical protein